MTDSSQDKTKSQPAVSSEETYGGVSEVIDSVMRLMEPGPKTPSCGSEWVHVAIAGNSQHLTLYLDTILEGLLVEIRATVKRTGAAGIPG